MLSSNQRCQISQFNTNLIGSKSRQVKTPLIPLAKQWGWQTSQRHQIKAILYRLAWGQAKNNSDFQDFFLLFFLTFINNVYHIDIKCS